MDIDSLLHHAHIVAVAGESYRFKHQRQAGMMHSAASDGLVCAHDGR